MFDEHLYEGAQRARVRALHDLLALGVDLLLCTKCLSSLQNKWTTKIWDGDPFTLLDVGRRPMWVPNKFFWNIDSIYFSGQSYSFFRNDEWQFNVSAFPALKEIHWRNPFFWYIDPRTKQACVRNTYILVLWPVFLLAISNNYFVFQSTTSHSLLVANIWALVAWGRRPIFFDRRIQIYPSFVLFYLQCCLLQLIKRARERWFAVIKEKLPSHALMKRLFTYKRFWASCGIM